MQEGWSSEGIDLAFDRALVDVRLAPPLAQAAALVRLVEMQAALITDLRNRVARLEGLRHALGLVVCLFVCLFFLETNTAAAASSEEEGAPIGASPPALGEPVDALIVTGLDVSSSIDAAELALQVGGMGAAIRSPDVLAAIARGPHHRIGFAVFLWSDGPFPLCGSWRVIATAADAAAAAEELEARCPAEIGLAKGAQNLTNLSRALEEGGRLMASAPFLAPRQVLNIVGDGEDNVGDDAAEARDRLVAAGISINGVVTEGDPAVLAYYKASVIAGPMRFAIPATDPASLADAFRRKFVAEISMVQP